MRLTLKALITISYLFSRVFNNLLCVFFVFRLTLMYMETFTPYNLQLCANETKILKYRSTS